MLIVDKKGDYINIGDGWTVLATQCYLTKSCSDCLYNIYCKKLKEPMLKKVVDGLLSTFGKPSKNLIDQAREINYNNIIKILDV